jgi:hypothetical protein
MKTQILFASLHFAIALILVQQSSLLAQPSAWPTNNWVGYTYATTAPIQDPSNDIGNGNSNHFDLTFDAQNAPYTVQLAVDANTAFFRLQVQSIPELRGPGTYYIFIGNAANTQIGMIYLTISGNSGDIVVANASRSTSTVTATGSISTNVNGYVRVQQVLNSTNTYVDFQAPLSAISANLGIEVTTSLKFYAGTSTGAGNIGNINLDYMTSGGAIAFSALATASFDALAYGALPVELTSFTAHLKQGATQLKWRTATELNNYGFEIQRSTKKNVWEAISFVPGNGSTNSPRSYSYEDRLPNTASGQISYRLRQIDRDGTEEYSPVVMVRLNVNATFGIADAFPNPFNPSTTLSLNLTEAATVSVGLYDVTGRAVLTVLHNASLDAGSHSVMLNASDLPSGRYLAVMTSGMQHSVHPVLLSK